MKIGHPADLSTAPTAPLAEPAAAAVTRAAASHSAAPAGGASAKLELSSTAAGLLAGGAAPEFDAEKVARLTKAIEDGSFKVDPHAIADKLIANAQELLARVRA